VKLIRLGLLSLLLCLGLLAAATDDGLALGCKTYPCDYRVNGGALSFSFGKSEIVCRSTAGSGRFRTAATGSATIEFRRCREEATVFKFSCTGGAGVSRSIRTGALGAHIFAGARGRANLQFLGARISLACGGVRFNVEGYFIGRMKRMRHNRNSHRIPLSIFLYAHGGQGGGPVYDVYTGEDKTYELDVPWILEFGPDSQAMTRCGRPTDRKGGRSHCSMHT
jgi:hypothetical protein